MTNTLIAKIAKASLAVGALATDRTNEAQKYAYISADKILERAGDALAKVGVAILPSIVSESVTPVEYTDQYGKARTRFDASIEFSMYIHDGESELIVSWRGRGNDFAVPDKAMLKAITSGHKYFLMKLLNIGVGNEDGEHEAAQDSTSKTAATAPVVVKGVVANSSAAKPVTKPRASNEQIRELGDIGSKFYGDEWSDRLPDLVMAVTKGTTSDVSQLLPQDAAKLIAGIANKMAQVEQANGDVVFGS
jgi:hypothetical protein